jgi:hypothetical protein
MEREHKIISIASRDEFADQATDKLDAHSLYGWSIVSAYAVADPIRAMITHHFVLQRPKQPAIQE